MRDADFVSINCPLTAETRGMIGAPEYALMRPHAFFITTARGHIHDEAALAAALRDKRIAGAGLDVWATEPPPREHPLLAFDNVLISPHTAGVTREARRNMGKIAAEQVLAALDGERPPRMVNPDVWPVYARALRARVRICTGEIERSCNSQNRNPGIPRSKATQLVSRCPAGPCRLARGG